MRLTLMRRKWYRWLQTRFGVRSFVLEKADKSETTYVLISGGDKWKSIEELKRQGFKEEWPK